MKALHVSDSFKADALEQFKTLLANYKPTDGALNFKIDPIQQQDAQKMSVQMTSTAYLKMIALIQECSIEIAWHGLVERKDDHTFLITDILCYPQEVTSSTVDAKEKEYMEWLMALDDDTVNKLHYQGHSHVNMGVSPSGRDTDNWQKLFQMCQSPEDFYIVCIANKSGATTWRVYDNKTGFFYEDKDVVFKVITPEGLAIADWGKQTIKEFVTEIKTTPKHGFGVAQYTYDSCYNDQNYPTRQNTANTTTTSPALTELRKEYEEFYDMFSSWVPGSFWDSKIQCYCKPKYNKSKKGGKKK